MQKSREHSCVPQTKHRLWHMPPVSVQTHTHHFLTSKECGNDTGLRDGEAVRRFERELDHSCVRGAKLGGACAAELDHQHRERARRRRRREEVSPRRGEAEDVDLHVDVGDVRWACSLAQERERDARCPMCEV
eukprot:167127-Rhodomonas_salina.1